MANTTNFNWETPDDTDLVKDGALAIRTLGNSIDTSLVDLKGGTTGQVLSKTSNTDMDFTWVTSDDANAIQNAIVDAKGDLIAASAADTPARLAAGTNEYRLVADSAQTLGLKYVADTTNYAIGAKGDLLVGTAADTVTAVSVGTNNYVLTADSAQTSGVKWAAPSSGSMTLISRQNFSNVASISFSDVFTTTYENYLFVFTNVSAATVSDDFQCVFIKSGGTDQTTTYYGSSIQHAHNAQTFTWTQSSNASEFTMSAYTEQTVGYMFVTGSGAGQSGRLGLNGSLTSLNSGYAWEIDAFNGSNQTYTGIKFKSSSTNITGTITLYGLAKS